jgi:hypothetical protein
VRGCERVASAARDLVVRAIARGVRARPRRAQTRRWRPDAQVGRRGAGTRRRVRRSGPAELARANGGVPDPRAAAASACLVGARPGALRRVGRLRVLTDFHSASGAGMSSPVRYPVRTRPRKSEAGGSRTLLPGVRRSRSPGTPAAGRRSRPGWAFAARCGAGSCETRERRKRSVGQRAVTWSRGGVVWSRGVVDCCARAAVGRVEGRGGGPRRAGSGSTARVRARSRRHRRRDQLESSRDQIDASAGGAAIRSSPSADATRRGAMRLRIGWADMESRATWESG